jgi:hypothetical protein
VDSGYPSSMFVSPPAEVLECHICFDILRDPVQVCATHTYCNGCITEWKDTNNTCPECRVPTSRWETNRMVKIMIEELQVRCPHAACDGCPNSGGGDSGSTITSGSRSSSSSSSSSIIIDLTAEADDGHKDKKRRAAATSCDWTGQLKDRELHIAVCPFVEVPCPYAESGCTTRAPRGEMAAHCGDTALHLSLLMSCDCEGRNCSEGGRACSSE